MKNYSFSKQPKKRRTKWYPILWKRRNLRKIPGDVMTRIDEIASVDIVATSVLKIPESAIQKGQYQHLGIGWENGGLSISKSTIIPSSQMGKYSYRNRYGYVIIFKHRPMINRAYSWEVPNFGEWSKGSHSVDRDRRVYQRKHISPSLHLITIELLGEEIKSERYFILKFGIDEVLDKRDPDFFDKLKFNLNLLQENIGHCGVYASDAKSSEYLQTLYVSWEILPPGDREGNIVRILGDVQDGNSSYQRRQFVERYDYLVSLKPQKLIRGVNSFRRYFGVLFADDLVIFENVEYGNAIYVMSKNWEALSKLSRIELLSGYNSDVIRIPHIGTKWKEQVKDVIQRELGKQ